MYITSMVGIDVLATSDTGGVHRGITQSLDVSTVIDKLESLPVLVMWAGVKATVDINKTLQALETELVQVVVLCSRRFPEFYTSYYGA